MTSSEAHLADRVGTPGDAALSERVNGWWWVAHTRPRAEKALAEDLTRLHIHHYLPLALRVTRSRRTNRISRSRAPVFSGYLFFAGTDKERTRAVQTNRIVSVLTVANQAQLIEELRQIQRVLASETPFVCGPRIEVGRWVRLIAGPLEGVEGVVSRLRPPLRLFLNVDILGQSIVVETTRDAVEPIDPPLHTHGPSSSP